MSGSRGPTYKARTTDLNFSALALHPLKTHFGRRLFAEISTRHA
jgi:hypothetical protein